MESNNPWIESQKSLSPPISEDEFRARTLKETQEVIKKNEGFQKQVLSEIIEKNNIPHDPQIPNSCLQIVKVYYFNPNSAYAIFTRILSDNGLKNAQYAIIQESSTNVYGIIGCSDIYEAAKVYRAFSEKTVSSKPLCVEVLNTFPLLSRFSIRLQQVIAIERNDHNYKHMRRDSRNRLNIGTGKRRRKHDKEDLERNYNMMSKESGNLFEDRTSHDNFKKGDWSREKGSEINEQGGGRIRRRSGHQSHRNFKPNFDRNEGYRKNASDSQFDDNKEFSRDHSKLNKGFGFRGNKRNNYYTHSGYEIEKEEERDKYSDEEHKRKSYGKRGRKNYTNGHYHNRREDRFGNERNRNIEKDNSIDIEKEEEKNGSVKFKNLNKVNEKIEDKEIKKVENEKIEFENVKEIINTNNETNINFENFNLNNGKEEFKPKTKNFNSNGPLRKFERRGKFDNRNERVWKGKDYKIKGKSMDNKFVRKYNKGNESKEQNEKNVEENNKSEKKTFIDKNNNSDSVNEKQNKEIKEVSENLNEFLNKKISLNEKKNDNLKKKNIPSKNSKNKKKKNDSVSKLSDSFRKELEKFKLKNKNETAKNQKETGKN